MAERVSTFEEGLPVESSSCAECHTIYPLDEMIRHGNIFVCGNCKPTFMQKLAEGAAVPGTMRYAGFWRRFLAVFVDGLLMFLFNLTLQYTVLSPLMTASSSDPANVAANLGILFAVWAIETAIGFAYETILIWKYGFTLGKRICGVRVVTAEGKPLSYGLSVARYFSKILSAITLLIGYIIAAFDEERRSLHDRICNTRVIMD